MDKEEYIKLMKDAAKLGNQFIAKLSYMGMNFKDALAMEHDPDVKKVIKEEFTPAIANVYQVMQDMTNEIAKKASMN
jgi:hypothetical protein